MRFFANAKINLSLDVTGRLPDGYHEVCMLMQEVSLCDVVDIELADRGNISLSVKNSPLPCDEGNIAYRAAKLFYEKTGIDGGCDIVLEKHIPVCAGLGGGSADGAAVLKGLNHMYSNPLNTDELLKLGLSLGADVPFCIMGKTALAEGIGEKLSPIASNLRAYAVLIKPDINISTPEAYKAIDSVDFSHPDTDKCILALESGKAEELKKYSANAFEYVCCDKYPEINIIKNHLISKGASFAMMSGSGPTVYGLFETKEAADAAFESYDGSFGGGGVCELII